MTDVPRIAFRLHGKVTLPSGLDLEGLSRKAEAARNEAYAPYSGLEIGAAGLWGSGRVYTGVNVENGSFGLTICAERSAAVTAVSAGERRLVALAVAGDTDRVHTLSPCGACRQFLSEFSPGGSALVAFPRGDEITVYRLRDLLPEEFRLRSEASSGSGT